MTQILTKSISSTFFLLTLPETNMEVDNPLFVEEHSIPGGGYPLP